MNNIKEETQETLGLTETVFILLNSSMAIVVLGVP